VNWITETAYTGATAVAYALHFEPPPPCLSYLIVKADRRRGRPRAAARAIATGDPRIQWYAVHDEARNVIHAMTPDETYLLCCLFAVSDPSRADP
jgi:hypothetical protein